MGSVRPLLDSNSVLNLNLVKLKLNCFFFTHLYKDLITRLVQILNPLLCFQMKNQNICSKDFDHLFKSITPLGVQSITQGKVALNPRIEPD